MTKQRHYCKSSEATAIEECLVLEEQISLQRRVYYAARDGMAMSVCALLSGVSKEDADDLLDRVTSDDKQMCTPLVIAALNGHNHVIKILLNRFSPKVDTSVTAVLDGHLIEEATALWCAAGAGHYSVVKTLLHHGANVNFPTSTNSTPLRAACFDGRMDIVQYLVENGADIHFANKYNNTCLMIAAYRGHENVVAYLLSQNAEIDAQARCGATALHFAAENGQLIVVKTLLKHGAKSVKTKTGMTPLLTAADRTKSEVVEYLLTWKSLFSDDECLEALELLGASYANDKDHYSPEKAYYYLERAMKMRCCDSHQFEPKTSTPPILAYDNQIESQTLEELQVIRDDVHVLHMESLVIRERILGSDHPEVPHPVIYRGAVFADVGQFDKSINLLLHALALRHKSNTVLHKDLLRFAQVFSQMIHIGHEITFDSIYQVLAASVSQLENYCTDTESVNAILSHENNVYTVLYLLVITTKVIKKFTPEEEHRIHRLVYRLNKLPVKTQGGSSLLHLAVNTDTMVDDFHTKNVCKFPCAVTTRMLIECGADVNAMDNDRNSPLHIIVRYQKPITDFMTLHSIINQLIEAGAHLDCGNNNGETPIDAVLTGVAEIILRTQSKISLKCIVARAIRRDCIPFDEGKIPITLKEFIDMH